jgi:hypothetical protein
MDYYTQMALTFKDKGLTAIRNEDCDYISDYDNKKRYGVNIENEDGDVLDYEYFNSEKKAFKFINKIKN